MRKLLYSLLFLMACLCSFQACQQEEVMYYQGGNAVHFLDTVSNYSFIQNLEAVKDTMVIPVLLVGNPADWDRTFKVEVVEDEYTTATEGQYRILSSEVLAGDTCGYLYVEIMNPEKLDIETKTLNLHLNLLDNDELKAGGWLKYLTMKLTWSSDLVKPYSWRSMYYFICKKYSSNVYRAYIEATGLYEMYYSLTPDPVTGEKWEQNYCYVLGTKFGDWVRNYNATHDDVYRHDDGDYAGEEIIPIR